MSRTHVIGPMHRGTSVESVAHARAAPSTPGAPRTQRRHPPPTRGVESVMKRALAITAAPSVEPDVAPLLAAPRARDCLSCQLIGHRRLLCSRSNACRELPHVFALGPVLLLAWLATAVAFIAAIR
jgi:hypothetical protein